MLTGCGQCTPCRRQRRQHWVGRQLLEAREHAYSAFLTLTYSPEEDECSYEDVQLFAKRVRYRYAGHRWAYICRGELGETFGRFHWHMSAFGYPEEWPSGMQYFDEWPHGHVFVGEFTPESAAYVYAYTQKENDWGETRYSARPAIGYQGLMDLAELLATHTDYAVAPGQFQLDAGTYPLSYYAKSLVESRMVELGCKYVPPQDARQLSMQVADFRDMERRGIYDRPRRFVSTRPIKERRNLDGETQRRLVALKPRKPRDTP